MRRSDSGDELATAAGLPAAYAHWRASRLGRITDALEQDLLTRLLGPVRGLQILDVGCGDGALALALARCGARVWAVDTDPRMLEAARGRFARAGVEVDIRQASIEALPFPNGGFDAVCAVTVLCFVREPRSGVGEMVRVLRPGGRVVIGELGRWSSWSLWRRLRGWLGHATWRAARFHTPAQLHDLATATGLDVETIEAAIFYPPVGWLAAALAPADRWLGHRFLAGGAFLAMVATKPAD